MSKPPVASTIANPALFIPESVLHDIHSSKHSVWGPAKQPLWPTRNIAFSRDDRYRRRTLIRTLTSPGSSHSLLALGYQLFMCSRQHRCNSPLCNYCRTKMQDRYVKRVLNYFSHANVHDIYWLTVLDDVTYNPVQDAPASGLRLKRKIKRAFDNDAQLAKAQMFGAFELDVKNPGTMNGGQAVQSVLQQYGMTHATQPAFMPHFHAIVTLNGCNATHMKSVLKKSFAKPYQISASRLWPGNTKTENMTKLARYMFKFRYQFADNILVSKPSYGKIFDQATLRTYAETILAMTGSRGVRQYELIYNL